MRTTLNENLDQVKADGEKFAELAERAGSVARKVGLNRAVEAASGLAERGRQQTFQLIFGGEFNSGKSTTINALLGYRVMPTDEVEASAIPTYIRYANEERALLYPLIGGEPTEVRIDELEAHICVNQDDPDSESAWEYAELYLPLELLEQGLVIVDPPGTNNQDHRTEKNIEATRESDAVVYLFFATQGLTATQRDRVAEDLAGKECFWLVTHADSLRSDDAERKVRRRLESDLSKVRPHGEDVDSRIYFVNAHAAEETKADLDGDGFARSGMQDFETALGEFISGDRHRAKMTALCTDLEKLLAGLDESTGRQEQETEEACRRTHDKCVAALKSLQRIGADLSEARDHLTSTVARLVADAPSVYAKVRRLPSDPSEISYGYISGSPTAFIDGEINKKIRNEVRYNVTRNSRCHISDWFNTEIANGINERMDAATAAFNDKLRLFKQDLTAVQLSMDLPSDQQEALTEMPVRQLGEILDAIREPFNYIIAPFVAGFIGRRTLGYDGDWQASYEAAKDDFCRRVRAKVLELIADEADEISTCAQQKMDSWQREIEQSLALVVSKPLLDIAATKKGVQDIENTSNEASNRCLQKLEKLRQELKALHGELAIVQAGYTTR